MIRTIFILFAAAIVMSACSGTKQAIVREPGTYTAVTVPVLSDLWLDGSVQLATKAKRGCGQLSKNLLPAAADQDVTLDIEGNRDIFFQASRADAQTKCKKAGMFYATRGNVYTLKLETKNNQCEVSLLEKTPRGAQNKINTYPVFVSPVDGIKVCENKENLY